MKILRNIIRIISILSIILFKYPFEYLFIDVLLFLSPLCAILLFLFDSNNYKLTFSYTKKDLGFDIFLPLICLCFKLNLKFKIEDFTSVFLMMFGLILIFILYYFISKNKNESILMFGLIVMFYVYSLFIFTNVMFSKKLKYKDVSCKIHSKDTKRFFQKIICYEDGITGEEICTNVTSDIYECVNEYGNIYI